MTKNTTHNTVKQQIIFSFVGILILIIAPEFAFSNALNSDSNDWKKAITKHTTLYYQDSEDLEKLNTRLNFNHSTETSDISAIVTDKVDALFKRSQQILGMVGYVNKISIKVFKNKEQLDRAYAKIYKTESISRAWYTHELLTVFIQLDDLHEGILAHEFAHAIIDHYLIVPPPGETAEILARYVDTHIVNSDPKLIEEKPVLDDIRGYQAQ